MHSVCRLSRRWHQQFCRSPNFIGHQKCLQILQPFREYRQATRERTPIHHPTIREKSSSPAHKAPSPNHDVVVREYAPDPNDESKLNRIEPNQEIVEELATARSELMKLDRELAVLRQGPFGPQSEFMQSLQKDEREQLLQALTQEGVLPGQQEDLLTMAEIERLSEEEADDGQNAAPKRLAVTLRIPKKNQAYIRQFNQALQAVEEQSERDVQKTLNVWRWYLRCQQNVHNFSSLVSDNVWQFLWESQAALAVRPKHLVMLAKDMMGAKIQLTPAQCLTYIKSLYICEDIITALKVWQDQSPGLRNDPETADESWYIGVRLYATLGNPSKAQELAFKALNAGKADLHVFVPVISAWAKSQDPDALVKAWTCYLKVRDRAGNTMIPELYESISNAFLDNNNRDMALHVFKDMVFMREKSSHDSQETYKNATQHLGEVLQHATTEEQINHIGLSALLVLPKSLQNRFFFTAWIKKLIGERRIDSAAMVVELMYERGIAPDAKPLNGIIAAWLREGTVSAQKKAEELAWLMIEARAAFVVQRGEASETKEKAYRSTVLDYRSQSVQRRVPSATIETFSILLQHYTRRQDASLAEKLTNTMINSCHIRPNSYIMNHWLYGDLRAGRIQMLWNKYCNLKQDIRPDLETFAALWDAAKVQFSKVDSAHAKYFPSARELFAEMMGWMSILSPKKIGEAKEEFSVELYEQIVRAFCLSTDLPGTLAAVHQLALTFEAYPTINATRLVCGQAARLLPQEELQTLRGPRTRRHRSRDQSVIARVADIISTIEARRKIALVDEGVDPELVEDPRSEVAGRLRLAVLTEFMCMFMQRSQGPTGSYRNDVKIAAEKMGVDLQGIDLDVPDE